LLHRRQLKRTRRGHAARAAPWPAPVCAKAPQQLRELYSRGRHLRRHPCLWPPPPMAGDSTVFKWPGGPRRGSAVTAVARCRGRGRGLSPLSSPLPAGSASPTPVSIVSCTRVPLFEETLLSNEFIAHAMQSSLSYGEKSIFSALSRDGED
jgi:hypothetical protein